MYFYITQNNSKFGAGSLREHCIIMFQKSLLPLGASAALTEPAGLSMTGRWDADRGLCESDWRDSRNDQPAKPHGCSVNTGTAQGSARDTNFKVIRSMFLYAVIFLSSNFSFTALDFMEKRELK